MTAPKLPTEISPDGREVFDWALRFSDHTQRIHRRREVWTAIQHGESQCGTCKKWMTDACPRERQDNTKGRKVGPSAGALKCDQHDMSAWDRNRIDGLKREYAALAAETAPKA